MTWVAWRQYRLELIIALVLLVALTAFLVPTGVQKLALFRDSDLMACLNSSTEDCSGLTRRFLESYGVLSGIVMWFVFTPAIIGMLLAAPIVLEFEQRTYRLAWTQSITRGRWLAVRLGLALLGALAFAMLLTPLTTWWFAPQDRLQDSFATSFYLKGAMPFVYTVFTLALALVSGVLSRRTLLAMVVTVVGFLVAMLTIANGLRPHYLPPIERIEPITASSLSSTSSMVLPDRAWVVGSSIVDPEGNVVGEDEISRMCGPFGKQIVPCLQERGLKSRVVYHPANRFWTFQAIEASIFLAAAAVLLGLTVWVVRRRMS